MGVPTLRGVGRLTDEMPSAYDPDSSRKMARLTTENWLLGEDSC